MLENPANRHRAVAFTPKQFHHAFTTTLDEEESRGGLRPLPRPGSGPLGLGRGARQRHARPPGHLGRLQNADRAPLLFIAGGEDQIVPAAVNKANAEHYGSSGAHTDYKEFGDRDHYTIGAPGWEEVANAARTWAIEHAQAIQHTVERQQKR